MKYFIATVYLYCLVFLCTTLRGNLPSELTDQSEVHLKTAETYFRGLQYDSASFHFKKALESLSIENNWELYCSTTNFYIETLWQQEKYSEARKTAYQNLGYCYKYLGANNRETANTYVNLGVLGFITGHTGISHEYFIKALDIFNRNYGEKNLHSAKVYEWLGICHNSFSDTANAKKYLWKALKIQNQLHTTNTYQCADLYRYIGLFCKRFSIFDSALFYYQKAKSIFDAKYTESNYKSIKCRNNIADVYEWFGEFDTALAIHNHSLELIGKSKVKNRYALMMTYFNISELYSNFGDFQNALIYMQKVLKLYFPDIEEDSIFSNPKNVESLPPSSVKVALAYKARYLYETYNQDRGNNYRYLISSAECYGLLDKTIQSERSNITNIDELIFFEHLNNNLYQLMADNALLVYETTGDTSFVSKALTYLSTNRNTNQIISDTHYKKEYLSNVPESYTRTKTRLQNDLNELLSRRLSIDKADTDKYINTLIAGKKIELDVLAHNISQDKPEMMSGIYTNNAVHLQPIHDKLLENQALVWYHEYCGDYIQTPDSILIIAISKKSFQYCKIDGKRTISLINQYQKLITNDFSDNQKIDSVGYLLFSLVMGPVKDIALKKELIVVPSQHISMVPFDALPIENSIDPKRMIENSVIWNEYSIGSFLQNNSPQKREDNVLAVAPQFNRQQKEAIAMLTKRDTSLINLPGAITECKNIGRLFNTKILYGENATRSAFEKDCSGYDLIHLSTHAIPDKENQSTIRLVFSDYRETGNEGSLDLYDVLNLPIHADLVVLSACKTGFGEMNKGEGNINLAWAFNKAGANSVVVNLWDANDYSSSVIMAKFYEYLSEGMTKPKALRQSKLDFIKSSDELTNSPYFWAGFEYWGNNTAYYLNKQGVWPGKTLILFIVFAISAVMIIKLRK